MIFSQWRPDGGYEYYATTSRRALGSDLPTPSLPMSSVIGVASTDIGRPMPAGAKRVGSGPIARGQIVRMASTAGLGMLPAAVGDMALLAAAALFGWWLRGALRKEAY